MVFRHPFEKPVTLKLEIISPTFPDEHSRNLWHHHPLLYPSPLSKTWRTRNIFCLTNPIRSNGPSSRPRWGVARVLQLLQEPGGWNDYSPEVEQFAPEKLPRRSSSNFQPIHFQGRIVKLWGGTGELIFKCDLIGDMLLSSTLPETSSSHLPEKKLIWANPSFSRCYVTFRDGILHRPQTEALNSLQETQRPFLGGRFPVVKAYCQLHTSGRWFGHEIMCINQLSPEPRGTPRDKDNLVPLQDADVPNLSTTCFWSLTWGQPKIRNEGGVEFASFPYKSIQNLPNCIMGVSQNFGTPPKKAWRFRKLLPFEDECPVLIIELLIQKNHMSMDVIAPVLMGHKIWQETKGEMPEILRKHGIFPMSVQDFHHQYLRNNLNIYGRNPWRLLSGMKLTVFLFVFKGSEGWKLHRREKVDPSNTCSLLAMPKRLTYSLPKIWIASSFREDSTNKPTKLEEFLPLPVKSKVNVIIFFTTNSRSTSKNFHYPCRRWHLPLM